MFVRSRDSRITFSFGFRSSPAAGLFLLAALLFDPVSSHAANLPFRWVEAPTAAKARTAPELARLPLRYRVAALDREEMTALLRQVPSEGESRSSGREAFLDLPFPDGSYRRFRVEESAVLADSQAALFPEIRTFRGQGVDDPTLSTRFRLGSGGFRAIILGPAGTVSIEPMFPGEAVKHIVYFERSIRPLIERYKCLVQGTSADSQPANLIQPTSAPPVPGIVRTDRHFRLAVATTGEYAVEACKPKGPGLACALQAVVDTINMVDAVFERELTVHLDLVVEGAGGSTIFTDQNTDPFDTQNSSVLFNENRDTLNARIGLANYDIGFLLTAWNIPIAWVGAACDQDHKAFGTVGLVPALQGIFAVEGVAHEIGHQLGANHTFNGTAGSCSGGRSAATAYEPGSGSTIMAYALAPSGGSATCGNQNLQQHDDDYFHAASLAEIESYISNEGNCWTNGSIANTSPDVSAGPAHVIPYGTPFTLTGSALDTDEQDSGSLTYGWEEYDLGDSSPPDDDATGPRPIFRSFPPTASPDRTFPRWQDILSGSETLGESLPRLPTQPAGDPHRDMTFRLTVRDNRAGAGTTASADAMVTVRPVGPFAVTAPANGVSWPIGSTQTVTWDVAGTAQAPISCANVGIDLTDEAQSFQSVLLASAPNVGAATVIVPNVPSSLARVRVRCLGNVFFALSRRFSIPAGSPLTLTQQPADRSAHIGESVSFTVAAGGGSTPFHFQWQFASASGSFAPLSNGGGISGADTATLTISPIAASHVGAFRAVITDSAPTPGTIVSNPALLSLVAQPMAPSGLTAWFDLRSRTLHLAWVDNSSDEEGFQVQFSYSGSAFSDFVPATVGPNVTAYSSAAAPPTGSYQLRVRSFAAGLSSAWSNVAPLIVPTVVDGYQGCYTDAPTRALPVQLGGITQTLASCIQAAFAAGYRYAGLQFSGYCFAGDSLGYALVSDAECNTPCTADPAQMCGGAWRNSIYATGYSPPTTPAAPSGLTARYDAPSSTIRLDWLDNSANEQGFEVQFSYSGSAFADFFPPTVGPNATSYTSGANPPIGSYQFRVRAFAGGFSSDWSNIVSLLVIP